MVFASEGSDDCLREARHASHPSSTTAAGKKAGTPQPPSQEQPLDGFTRDGFSKKEPLNGFIQAAFSALPEAVQQQLVKQVESQTAPGSLDWLSKPESKDMAHAHAAESSKLPESSVPPWKTASDAVTAGAMGNSTSSHSSNETSSSQSGHKERGASSGGGNQLQSAPAVLESRYERRQKQVLHNRQKRTSALELSVSEKAPAESAFEDNMRATNDFDADMRAEKADSRAGRHDRPSMSTGSHDRARTSSAGRHTREERGGTKNRVWEGRGVPTGGRGRGVRGWGRNHGRPAPVPVPDVLTGSGGQYQISTADIVGDSGRSSNRVSGGRQDRSRGGDRKLSTMVR